MARKMPRVNPNKTLRQLRGQQRILALMSILPAPPKTKGEIAADKAERYPEAEIFDTDSVTSPSSSVEE